MFSIGVLMVSVLSACSSPADSIRGPEDSPLPLSTDTPVLVTATPELSSTTASPSEQPGDVVYSSVAEALADLKTRDDVSIKVLQGWTIVAAVDGLTTWSFAPPDHPAYPAVAKRVLYRDKDGWHLRMDILCEADTPACDEFVRHFEALNEPIYQMIDLQN